MHAVAAVRLVALAVVIVFSVIVLGISANLVHGFAANPFLRTPSWLGYTLFVAIITLLITVPVLVIDQMRNGAITSLVVVELAYTAILGIFWLAAAAAQSSSVIIPGGDCTITGDGESVCRQFQAMQAFSWLNWLILWGWTFALVVCSVIALSRGNRGVWTAPAGQTDFFARGEQSTIPPVQQQSTGATYNTYPPQQQAFAQPGVQPQYTGQPAHV